MVQYKYLKKFPGVRYREHRTRKNGVRFDRYYQIRYQRDGKQITEGLGWASEGWGEKKAAETLVRIKEAVRTGKGLQSLKESREIARKERAAEAERKRQERLASLTFSLPIARQDKKPRSWKTEDSWFRNWIHPVISSMALADIAPIHIEIIKRNMLKADKAPRSVQYWGV